MESSNKHATASSTGPDAIVVGASVGVVATDVVVAPDVVAASTAATVVVGVSAAVVATGVALGAAMLISAAVVAGVSGSELPLHAVTKRTRLAVHMDMVTFEVIKQYIPYY